MALTYTQITETFSDGTGQPLSSINVSFAPSEPVYAAGIPVVTPATPITAEVVGGALKSASGGTLQLLDTSNTGLTIEGRTGFWYWTVTITGQLTDSFSFFLPHSASPVDLYSLANTSASGGSGFTNPMTALGDMIDGGAAGAATRLAGDTSNTRKFLRSLSSGGVATAPVWDTLVAADVPGVDGVTVSGTPISGQVPTATSGSAATWQTPAAGFQPWQFQPETFGAKGDGKVIADAMIAGGSLSTLTSASAAFTSNDTGKHIVVNDAGAGALPLCTTITFVNATTVTLGSAASGAVTNAAAFYATDDTAAINSAVTAAGTYALANNYFAEVLITKPYGVAGAPTQTGNGSTTPTFNAQIPLPFPAANGTSRKLVIALTGPGDGSQCQYFDSTIPNLQGAALVSMVQAPAQPDATFGWQSVIGGPSSTAGFTGHFANTKAVITGLTVWTPLISKQYAIDLRYIGGMRIDRAGAQAFASVAGGAIPLPNLPGLTSFQNAASVGLYSPVIGNNDDCYVGSFAAEGFTTGVQADDHFTALRLACIYTNIGLELNALGSFSGVSHRVTIANYSCEASNAAISCNGGTMPVDITMTAEVINTADVQDNSNSLLGTIRWYSESVTVPAVQGGAHVRIINDVMGPGPWSGAPAAPTQGVAQQNTAWRDATVWVTSTAAITAVAVDGTSVFSGSVAAGVPVPVRVPGGHTYTVTSAAGALTTHWVLE